MKARNLHLQPVKSVRTARNKPAVRYYLHVFEIGDDRMPTREAYAIRRVIDNRLECWCGRERGWEPLTLNCIGKVYSRHGDAYKTLRRLQGMDREALSADGRRRHLERLAPDLLKALRGVLDSAEGTDYARKILRIADRGY